MAAPAGRSRRDAYTNTVETERMREILKKELRVRGAHTAVLVSGAAADSLRAQATDASMKAYASMQMEKMARGRANGVTDLEKRMRARMNNRKCVRRPAACCRGAGEGAG